MTEHTASSWRFRLKHRLAGVAGVFILWTCAIEARLVYLQVVRHDQLTARAERQHMQEIPAPAKRGEIRDRRGRVLAYSVDADSIYGVPTEIDDAASTAAAVCDALSDCTTREQQTLIERFATKRPFVYVRRKVTPDQARRVAVLNLQGLGFMKEDRRFYPNKELGAHVLGYVGIDNEGLSGIEATYDSLIKGRPGTVLFQTDARRHAFSRFERPPTIGASLELTIDQYLQHVAEREVQAAVEQNGAASGTAIVMDPKSGEILALANAPTFNPNAFSQAREPARRNRAVQDLYEPGSTFKIVTASAAFEENVVRPDERIDVSAGSIRFGSRVIHDDHPHGVLSFEDVIVLSSNVGAIKVGLKIGPERLSDYVRRFGFGRRSSPDFPSESPGIVWNAANLTDSAVASVSMGYQVAVTPLQMAAAVSSVANGGELIEPRIVRAVIRDGNRTAVPRKVLRRPISPETAAELTRIMEGVVERGTAKRAQIAGFTIAGKTGTAQKLVNGSYRGHGQYNASFVGFVPSRDPLVAIVVVIDSPRAHGYYGGLVAAPVFKNIAEAALRHQGVAPSLNAPPPLLVARHESVTPLPMAAPAKRPAIVTVSTRSETSDSVFPDLRGLNARDALRSLARLGMTARLNGAGLVIDQAPRPGAPVERGAMTTLWLQREPMLASRTEP